MVEAAKVDAIVLFGCLAKPAAGLKGKAFIKDDRFQRSMGNRQTSTKRTDRPMFHPTIKFAPANIAALKKALRKQYAHVGSSHADEALAASFGFKSHAAMLSVLNQVSQSARLMIQSNPGLLLLRLEQLGYKGLEFNTLRRLAYDTEYPDNWQDDGIEHSLKKRFVPVAANSQ